MAKCSILCQIGNVQTLTLTFAKSRVQWAQNRISEWEYSDHTPKKIPPESRPFWLVLRFRKYQLLAGGVEILPLLSTLPMRFLPSENEV